MAVLLLQFAEAAAAVMVASSHRLEMAAPPASVPAAHHDVVAPLIVELFDFRFVLIMMRRASLSHQNQTRLSHQLR